MTQGLIFAFNIGALNSLKLWNYLGSSELLERLAKFGKAIRLTSFEFTADNMDYVDSDTEPIIVFLEHFQGLRDIYLLLPGPVGWDFIGRGILNHKSTLRRLLMHDRTIDLTRHCDRFEDICDGNVDWSEEAATAIEKSPLRCLGISNGIDYLV